MSVTEQFPVPNLESEPKKNFEDFDAGDYKESLSDQHRVMRAVESGKGIEEALITYTEEERLAFLKRVASGELSREMLLAAIERTVNSHDDQVVKVKPGIRFNLEPFRDITDELKKHPAYGILFNLLLDKEPAAKISWKEIADILNRYPEPYEFEAFIERVSETLPETFRKDAEKHARTLATMIYGEKERYWEQIKLMESEARYIFGSEKNEASVLFPLEIEKSRELLRRVQIHGDPWNGKRLTTEHLAEQNLAPKYEAQIEGQKVWFSSLPYVIGHGRIAVVGYVEGTRGELIARSFYRSNSHGIWKYLPRYVAYDGRLTWYGKGFGQESISLPIPLQRALAEIGSADPGPMILEDPEFIFAGTARGSQPLGKYDSSTYANEVDELPVRLKGNFYGEGKIPPKELVFENQEQLPDFRRSLGEWHQTSSQYGEIRIEVFPSRNSKYQYMFCSDKLGRVWIGAIDSDALIGTTGLREHWVEAGDLTTPAFQYFSEADRYGNADMVSGDYVDMFKNYLSKVPVIQDYLALRKNKK